MQRLFGHAASRFATGGIVSMSTRSRTRQRRRSPQPATELDAEDYLVAVRALVESFAQGIRLPRGVPSAPGQPGHASWRAAREWLLYHQLNMLAEEAREQAGRETASS
jgi:hypothetical protein